MSELETWILDIETSPLKVYVWELGKNYVITSQVVEDWKIIAWSAKRLFAPKNEIIYKDLRKNPSGSDEGLIKPLVKLLDQADIVITYNGKRFDLPKIAARTILNKITPYSKVRHFDVWELVARTAAFTSTKFEYVSDKVNKNYKKLSHSKFPGLDLWKECLNGNISAWEEMKRYNLQDTLGTEETAILLKQWAPKSFPDWEDEKCDECNIVKKIRIKCNSCGRWRNK